MSGVSIEEATHVPEDAPSDIEEEEEEDVPSDNDDHDNDEDSHENDVLGQSIWRDRANNKLQVTTMKTMRSRLLASPRQRI